jgi:malate permease and related proteins
MGDYQQLLILVSPVFAVVGLGALLRRARWLTSEADASLLKLVVSLLYPCLIFVTILGNPAVSRLDNLAWAPLVGFLSMTVGFAVGWLGGRAIGLSRGAGLRTFAFAVGIYNYGYVPIPLVESLFGRETLAVLLVHNVGAEIAIWSVGIVMLSGLSLREGWRRVLSPPLAALVLALALNFSGLAAAVPEPALIAARSLAATAVPLGLLLIGAMLYEFLGQPRQLWNFPVVGASCGLRLGLLPVAFLAAAWLLPLPLELKQVMVIQAAMPAGILPLVIASHYGGHPLTAAQVIVGTSGVGLVLIPLWIQVGRWWLSV